MKHEQQIVIKRWVPILEEYERTRTKQTPRVFKNIRVLWRGYLERLSGVSLVSGVRP